MVNIKKKKEPESYFFKRTDKLPTKEQLKEMREKVVEALKIRLSIVLIIVLFLFPISIGNAADLELDDLSGEAGPAPPPAPYATTVLRINNAPNDISWLRVSIVYDHEVLGGYSLSLNQGLIKDWQYAQSGHVSGASGHYYYIEGWTTETPIPAGNSGNLAEIKFKVLKNENSTVTISGLEHDIEGWATKSAAFTYSQTTGIPIADAGQDQVVFGQVLLDGSGSQDPDGSIVSWEWSLNHRTNSTHNKTATGKNPAVSSLSSGFYNVTLTVTDNNGLTSTDVMLLAVIGGTPGDANQNGQVDLPDIIYNLQILTGIRSP